MAAVIRIAVASVALLLAVTAEAQTCTFADGDYVDPTAPGCGDVLLRYTDAEVGEGLVPLGYPVPAPVESLAAVDGFRSYASLHAGQQDLMLTHPEVHGEVVGRTHAGRDLWAYRIGTDGATTIFGQPKGAVMAVGGIHAREWQSPEVVAEVLERGVAMLDDGGFGRYLGDNLRILIVPVLNIDGLLQTQRFFDRTTADLRQPRDGRMRRKNMHYTPSGGVVDEHLSTVEDNFHGVDLNRNNPVGFQSAPQNTNPTSLIYAGASAHGEAELQALLAAADLGPATRLRLYLDVHSFTQIYFIPGTGDASLDTLTRTVADRMRAVTGNKYRSSVSTPGGGIGTTADYFANTYRIPAWTLETEPLNGGQDYGGTGVSHSGFITPDREIARVRDELAQTILLGFYHQAGPPSVVAADIRDSAGTVVWSAQWESTGPGSRTLAQVADEGLVAGQAYTLWVAFDKPMRWRVGGEIAPYPGQPAAPHPVMRLEVAGSGGNRVIALPEGEWLAEPGPGPDGFLNYRDDAYATTFVLPADLPEVATQALLVIDTVDLAGLRVDSNPATAVDWDDGRWRGYEDETGADSLTGGPDCTLKVWIGTGQRGTHDLVCMAAQPPPVQEPPQRRRGGGALGALWLSLVIASVAASRRRRSVSVPESGRTREWPNKKNK